MKHWKRVKVLQHIILTPQSVLSYITHEINGSPRKHSIFPSTQNTILPQPTPPPDAFFSKFGSRMETLKHIHSHKSEKEHFFGPIKNLFFSHAIVSQYSKFEPSKTGFSALQIQHM